MKVYISKDSRLIEIESSLLTEAKIQENNFWIDLFAPTAEEITKVEELLAVKIPTREEMQEIESSSRLYKENDTLIMTILGVKRENSHAKAVNVTFLLKGNLLVTLRYDDILPLNLFLKTACGHPSFPVDDSVSLLLGMLEAFIEKIADNLENTSTQIEHLSQKIFVESAKKNKDLSQALITMGLQGEINSKTRDSLASISRMSSYLKFNISQGDESRFKSRLETLASDSADLKDYSAFLGHKIGFMLDASLGLINIEQNNIIKIFSIAAVVLLPPTLIASIYGMNFHFMPELKWPEGYPLALLLMLLSAIVPYLYIKKKGWL